MLNRRDVRASAERSRQTASTPSSPLIVLANRAPVWHQRDAQGRPTPARSASGLVTAVEPLLAAESGTWIARGDTADLEAADAHHRVRVSTASGSYSVRYVAVPAAEYEGFYTGFANEALWPLCHSARVPPVFRAADFSHYSRANRRFAREVCREAATAAPTVLVQDYHFALAPGMVRRSAGNSRIAAFWHIPWPPARILRACPWARRVLEGLLGSDVIGVQTDDDRRHFLESVMLLLDLAVDTSGGTIEYRGRTVRVSAHPVGVDWSDVATRPWSAHVECRSQVFAEHALPGHARLVVGIDRMDYTKGIVEKFHSLERLLERRPDLRRSLVLLQVAEPSRQSVEAYRSAAAEAREVCDRINVRFGDAGWQPIRLLERHVSTPDVHRLYRAADICWVNSVDDGMNLVAKEFVAARSDERGVLVLSEFAGAARQLSDALLVNPYAGERTARTLERALEMTPEEQERRMRELRDVVRKYDSRWWATRLLADVAVSPSQATQTAELSQDSECLATA